MTSSKWPWISSWCHFSFLRLIKLCSKFTLSMDRKEKLELTMMLKRIHNGNVEKDKKRTSFPSFLSTHSSTHYLQLPGYQSLQEDESHDDASSKSNDVDDSFSATEMKDKQRINSFILTSIKEENVEYTQSEKRSQMHSSFESLNDELSDRINKLLQSMKKDCQVTEEKSEQESNHVMGHHHQNINISLVSNSAGQSDGVSSNPQNGKYFWSLICCFFS